MMKLAGLILQSEFSAFEVTLSSRHRGEGVEVSLDGAVIFWQPRYQNRGTHYGLDFQPDCLAGN